MAVSTKPAPVACASGQHRARRVPIRAGATQTTCLDCGCVLIRTGVTRRWVYSGELT